MCVLSLELVYECGKEDGGFEEGRMEGRYKGREGMECDWGVFQFGKEKKNGEKGKMTKKLQ